jgi:hypothetical protein
MKIYILVTECVYDYESSPINVEKWENKEDAVNALKGTYENYIKDMEGLDMENEWDDNPSYGVVASCESYLEGRWSEHHFVGSITEFDV